MNLIFTKAGQMLVGKDEVSRLLSSQQVVWDDHIAVEIDKYATPGKIALDIGANIGYFTLYLAKRFKSVKAFEPQKFLYYQLCGNVASNELTNVDAFNIGCYSESGFAELESEPNYLEVNNSASLMIHKRTDGNIPLETIDSFNFDNVGLIKIDAQGSDYQIIKGCYETIRKCRPVIIFEIENPSLLDPHDTKANDFYEFSKQNNYIVKNIKYSDFIMIPDKII